MARSIGSVNAAKARGGVAADRLIPFWQGCSPAASSQSIDAASGSAKIGRPLRPPSWDAPWSFTPLSVPPAGAPAMMSCASAQSSAANNWLRAWRQAGVPLPSAAGRVRFQMWLKRGYLNVKAVSMNFTFALPVWHTDLHSPALSSLLHLWLRSKCKRGIAFEQYMRDAAERDGDQEGNRACGDAEKDDAARDDVVVFFKSEGMKLQLAWEVERSEDRFYCFAAGASLPVSRDVSVSGTSTCQAHQSTV